MFERIRQFYEDLRGEFKKVQWPTREATLKSTGIVIGVAVLVAIFLGVVDFGLTHSVQFIISG